MGKTSMPNKNTALSLDQKAISGVDAHFAGLATVTLAGTSYSPVAMKAVLQAEIDLSNAVDALRAEEHETLAKLVLARAGAHALRKALRAYLLANYGANAAQMLGDFGMSPPKPTNNATVKTKAEAVVKAKATRVARHTMGKRQRLRIKAAPLPAAATDANVSPLAEPAPAAASPAPKP